MTRLSGSSERPPHRLGPQHSKTKKQRCRAKAATAKNKNKRCRAKAATVKKKKNAGPKQPRSKTKKKKKDAGPKQPRPTKNSAWPNLPRHRRGAKSAPAFFLHDSGLACTWPKQLKIRWAVKHQQPISNRSLHLSVYLFLYMSLYPHLSRSILFARAQLG